MRAQCPQKEHYHYVDRLRPRKVQWALRIGTAFHAGMEVLNGGGTEQEAVNAGLDSMEQIASFVPSEEREKFVIEKIRTEVMIRQAAQRFPGYRTPYVEYEFSVPIRSPYTHRASRSYTLAGKADAIAEIEGQLWLVEYKTTGSTIEQRRESFGLERQITLYTYALSQALGHRIQGVLMRIVQKPRTEPKRKGGQIIEPWDEYEERLMQWYDDNADTVIAEDLVTRSDKDLERFAIEIWSETKERLFEEHLGIVRRNTNACGDFGGCPFRDICLNIDGWENQYYISNTSHDELSVETATAAI